MVNVRLTQELKSEDDSFVSAYEGWEQKQITNPLVELSTSCAETPGNCIYELSSMLGENPERHIYIWVILEKNHMAQLAPN